MSRKNPNRKLVAEFHRAFDCVTPAEMMASPSLGKLSAMDVSDLHHLAQAVRQLAHMAHLLAKENAHNDSRNIFLRVQLMTEELSEVIDAISKADIVETAHELADLEYVVQGTVLALGLDGVFEECVQEVHRANMNKLVNGKPVVDEAGRVQKAKGFQPASLHSIVMQGYRES